MSRDPTELEVAIRSAARSGRLSHFSLAPSNGKWCASYRGVDDPDKRIVDHADPVSALLAALTGRKPPEPEKTKAARRSRKPAAAEIDEEML